MREGSIVHVHNEGNNKKKLQSTKKPIVAKKNELGLNYKGKVEGASKGKIFSEKGGHSTRHRGQKVAAFEFTLFTLYV